MDSLSDYRRYRRETQLTIARWRKKSSWLSFSFWAWAQAQNACQKGSDITLDFPYRTRFAVIMVMKRKKRHLNPKQGWGNWNWGEFWQRNFSWTQFLVSNTIRKVREILTVKNIFLFILDGFGPPKDYLDGDGMGKRVEADPLCSLRNRNMNRNVNRNIPIKLFSLYN